MPQVPYTGVPSVAPSEQATPNISVDTPIAAFGGTVASAINSVGQVAQHAGNEIFQRAIAFQELQNETVARNQDAEYTVRAGEIEARFRTMQGQNAVQAQAKYNRDLQTLRQQFRDALPNDASRRTFDAHSISTMTRAIFSGATWSAVQNRTWATQASNSRRAANDQNVLANPTEGNYDAAMRANREEISGSGSELHGMAPETIEENIQKANSKTSLLYLRGLARTDPVEAQQFLERNRNRFHLQDIEAAERLVHTSLNTTQATRIATQVNPILPEGEEGPSLRDRLEQAKIWADAISDNPEFHRSVEQATRQQYDRNKSVLRDDQLNRDHVLIGAINGGAGGRLPTTVEELTASSPEASGAWDNTPEPRRRALMNMLAQNSRRDNQFSQESLRRYRQLQGLAIENPTEFLQTDVISEPNMPNSARLQLSRLQQQIMRVPDTNPHFRGAMQQLAPMLNSAGILTDRDRRLQFMGQLQDALQVYQRQNNKQPGPDDIQKIGAALLQPQAVPGWLWGTNQTPLYDIPVPSDLETKFRDRPEFRDRSPTQEELDAFRRFYRNERYKELFGGSIGRPKSN